MRTEVKSSYKIVGLEWAVHLGLAPLPLCSHSGEMDHREAEPPRQPRQEEELEAEQRGRGTWGDGEAACKQLLWPGWEWRLTGTLRGQMTGVQVAFAPSGAALPVPMELPCCPLALPCSIQTPFMSLSGTEDRHSLCPRPKSPLPCLEPSPSFACEAPLLPSCPSWFTFLMAGGGIFLKCKPDHFPDLSETL